MAHLHPLEYADIEDQEVRTSIEKYEELRGFVPNSIRTMARRPSIAKAFMALNQAVLYDGTVPEATKMLVSLASSLTSGCLYCQSHMTNLATIYKVADEKIADLLNYESSSHFTAAEKAALAVAFKAGGVPNEVTEADFDLLKEHYSEGEIVEIVGTIGLFGYLNRWNDTMATQIELVPSNITKRVLSDWEEGKHA